MTKKTNLPALALVVAAALASVAVLRAEDDAIFKANFSDQAVGDKPEAESGKCAVFTGPPGSSPAASCTIAAVDAGNGSPQNAAALRDPSGEIGPVLFLDAGNFLTETSPDLDGIVRLKLLVPANASVDGAGIFFGGLWREGGATLAIRLVRGKAWLEGRKEAPSPTLLGEYIPDTWMDLKVVLHFAGKTADIWWNGEEVAKDVPWWNPEPKDSKIALQAYGRSGGDDPVLCLAEAEIKLVSSAAKK